jgi:hypothetical protein
MFLEFKLIFNSIESKNCQDANNDIFSSFWIITEKKKDFSGENNASELALLLVPAWDNDTDEASDDIVEVDEQSMPLKSYRCLNCSLQR